jgi:hypothetical protein
MRRTFVNCRKPPVLVISILVMLISCRRRATTGFGSRGIRSTPAALRDCNDGLP